MLVQFHAVSIAGSLTSLKGEPIDAFSHHGSVPPETTHPAAFAFIIIVPVLGLANCLRTPLANKRETP